MSKFQKGHPGGPGRPKRQTEAEYLAVTMTACSLDTWKEIVDAAVRDAKAGDATARAWLGRYLIGDPATRAPAPTTVVIQQILGDDEAMDIAVRRLAGRLEPPMFESDDKERQQALKLLEGR